MINKTMNSFFERTTTKLAKPLTSLRKNQN